MMDIKSRLAKESHAPNLIPLIDLLIMMAIFLLIAFLETPLKGLLVTLPQKDAGFSEKILPPLLSVVIDQNQLLFFGSEKRAVDLSSLRTLLEDEAQKEPKSVLHMAIDRTVPYGLVAKILLLAQEMGLSVRLSYE